MHSLHQLASYFQPPALGASLFLAATALATLLVARRARASGGPHLAVRGRLRITVRLLRRLVVGLVALAVIIAMGVDLQGLWSMLAAVLSLVAIGFVAMWSILSHMLASVLLVTFRPFDLDDQIEIVGDDPIFGKVIDLNLVYTTLRTADGGTLRIPNNLFFQKVLKRHAPVPTPPPSIVTCL
jgi:small-conductance mechanosensitive channel